MTKQQELPFTDVSLEEIIERDAAKARLEAVCRAAHRVIHDKSASTVLLDGTEYPVYYSANGCRYMDYKDIKFMEQNKEKQSVYASQAREGKRITWGIRFGTWIYIDDDVVRA